MSRSGSEGIIPNVPVHVVLITQTRIDRESFKWEDTFVIEKLRKAGRQKNVHIQIDPSEPVNSQVTKKVVLLDRNYKRIENLPVMGKLVVYKVLDLLVIEEHVFAIGVEQRNVSDCRLFKQR